MKKILWFLVLCLGACTTNQPIQGTAIDDMNVALHQGEASNKELLKIDDKRNPSQISKALVPDLKARSPRRNYQQRRFDIAVKNVPAQQFYPGLFKDTPMSVVVSPEIQGNITLSLKQVSIEQVLQTLEDVYGYAYSPIPGGFEILPNSIKTKIYSVNYLELERIGSSNMRLSSGEVTQVASGRSTSTSTGTSTSATGGATNVESNIGDVQTRSVVNFWEKLRLTLENMIGTEGGRSVTVNPLAGVVVVRALPKELKQVEVYLDVVQNSMDRQVILEAKILEVTLKNQFQMGIDWKILGANLNAIRSFPGTDITTDDFPDAFKIDIKWAENFTTTIQALEEQGNVQVLSSPRVATMNNQKSAIKVGSDEFFVTNVSSSNSTTTTTTVGVPANTFPEVDLTPFFSGITLDVTPQIDINNNVTLHIHPAVSLVRNQHKSIDLGTQFGVIELPLAHSTIRESDTIVHAKNGQVIIIGGLMQNQTEEDVAELPVFGNIPFLGTLFRNTKQTSDKSELVILLRATVVNPRVVNRELAEATQRMASVKRGFHIGSRPDIFGTEGENPVTFGPEAGAYGQPR
jgi:MSHA biogenesis protein MshL